MLDLSALEVYLKNIGVASPKKEKILAFIRQMLVHDKVEKHPVGSQREKYFKAILDTLEHVDVSNELKAQYLNYLVETEIQK